MNLQNLLEKKGPIRITNPNPPIEKRFGYQVFQIKNPAYTKKRIRDSNFLIFSDLKSFE